jgi:NADP-dependent 3-hydroxy acid dehydrogenase YdfG
MNVCITGASSGIGRALVFQLLLSGHKVWGVAKDREALSALKKELPTGSDFNFSVADVGSIESVRLVRREMFSAGFYPEIIYLGAGILLPDTENGFNRRNFDLVNVVNFSGAINFVEVFLPEFLSSRSGGFVAFSSTTALRPTNGGAAYPASKAALAVAFRVFDRIYRPAGVFFSNAYIGPVETAILPGRKGFLATSPAKAAKRLASVLKTKKSVYFIPRLISLLWWFPPILPDRFFCWLGGIIKKINGDKK